MTRLALFAAAAFSASAIAQQPPRIAPPVAQVQPTVQRPPAPNPNPPMHGMAIGAPLVSPMVATPTAASQMMRPVIQPPAMVMAPFQPGQVMIYTPATQLPSMVWDANGWRQK